MHMPHPLKTIALIVAAGESSRFGGEIAKPYAMLAEKPVLRHSIETFLKHPYVDGVRVVISRPHHLTYKKIVSDLTLFPPMFGGKRRQDSVRLGLESLQYRNPHYVLIHDAARPLVNATVIDRVLEGLQTHKAVMPAMPVTDTIRLVENGKSSLLPRERLYAAQTPQGFDYQTILHLHQEYQTTDVTDDIALAERAGIPVKQVDGDTQNFKITRAEDLELAEYCKRKNV